MTVFCAGVQGFVVSNLREPRPHAFALPTALLGDFSEETLSSREFQVHICSVLRGALDMLHQHELIFVPEDVWDAVAPFSPRMEEFDYGRLGMRPITSHWVKTQYPHAKYEVLMTLVEKIPGGRVHTLLIYI